MPREAVHDGLQSGLLLDGVDVARSVETAAPELGMDATELLIELRDEVRPPGDQFTKPALQGTKLGIDPREGCADAGPRRVDLRSEIVQEPSVLSLPRPQVGGR